MAYVLTLHPTFTQGFILGQLSILLLLALILKYLFLDSSTEPMASPSAPLAHLANGTRESVIKLEPLGSKPLLDQEESVDTPVALPDGKESMEWFNLIIHEVCSFVFMI
jgi:maintenance of mitochondrial morphology protein 1